MNKIEVNEEAVKGPSEANHPHKRSDEAEKSFKPNPNAKELSLETGDDPELEANKARVCKIKEEFEILKQMHSEEDKLIDEAEKSFKSNPNQSDSEEEKVNLDTGYFSSEYLTPTNSSGSIPDFFSCAGISSRPDLIYNPYDQSYFSVNQNQTENILLEPNTEDFSSSSILSSSSGFSSPEFSSPNSLYYQRSKEQVYQMSPTCQSTKFYEQYDQTYFIADQTKTEDQNQILENIWLDLEANTEDPNQILANILLDWDANTEDFSPPMQSGFWAYDTFYQRWSTNSGVE